MITKNPNFNRYKVRKLDLNDFYITYSDFDGIVNDYQEILEVDLADKDATVISLSMEHPNKDKAKNILNNLVSVYNEYALTDKNTELSKQKILLMKELCLSQRNLEM